MKIRGMENMASDQVNFELQRGGKFVFFQYCLSLLVVTFKRSSDIYFIRYGESTTSKSIPFTLLSVVAGWWGIPWGPIYTIQSLVTNLKGGKDVTKEVVASFNKRAAQSVAATQAKPAFPVNSPLHAKVCKPSSELQGR